MTLHQCLRRARAVFGVFCAAAVLNVLSSIQVLITTENKGIVASFQLPVVAHNESRAIPLATNGGVTPSFGDNESHALSTVPIKIFTQTNTKQATRGTSIQEDLPTTLSSIANKTAPRSIMKRAARNITIREDLPPIQLVLIRAIGNALPPRHDAEQAYQNLKFTLQNECEFPHLRKHWLLNRLANGTLQQRLVELLNFHGENFTIIPFRLDEYDKVTYNFTNYQPLKRVVDVVHDIRYIRRTMEERNQVDEAINQDKNVFVTNQNAARNFMVDLGQAMPDVDWILPWDGNCFIHPNAYQDVYQALQAMPSNHNYAYTPMNRAQSNDEVLQETYHPDPIEEPQVIFRRNAKGRFHPRLRYGRRNKVEFLQRLGIKGPWDKWSPYLNWEKQHLGPFFQPIPDLQKDEVTKQAGWTTRLSSGKQHLEVKGTIRERGQVRLHSMILFLGQLDTRAAIDLHGYRPGQLVFYDEDALARDRHLYQVGDTRVKPVVDELLRVAQAALKVGPWSVMDKPDDSVAVSGDKHDYFHLSPYYHPKTETDAKNALAKWERKDGVRLPGTELYDKGSEKFDRTRAKDLHYNTTVLGLAYFMTGDKQYAEIAARNVRTWFLNPETRMNPNLNYAQVRNGYNNNMGEPYGIIEMKDLYFMLDAVRLIARDGFLSLTEQGELRKWFAEYLKWLETSDIGMKEYAAENNHGLYFDVQAAAIASFINDTAKFIMYMERSTSRLLAHISRDGKMPKELSRPTCEHYQIFTLQGWSILSRLGQTVNRNLWKYHSIDGTSPLCRASKYSVPFYGRESKCESKVNQTENVERWWPLLHESLSYCPELQTTDIYLPSWFPPGGRFPPTNAHSMPNMYHGHDGIAPFWNLGMISGNLTWQTHKKVET